MKLCAYFECKPKVLSYEFPGNGFRSHGGCVIKIFLLLVVNQNSIDDNPKES